SAYAVIQEGTSKYFYLSILDSDVSEESLTKEIDTFECVDCDDDDCGASSARTLSVQIADLMGEGNVDANGFPAKDSYEKTSSATTYPIISFSVGTDSKLGGKASGAVLTFGSRPTKVGDEVELTIDSGFFPISATD